MSLNIAKYRLYQGKNVLGLYCLAVAASFPGSSLFRGGQNVHWATSPPDNSITGGLGSSLCPRIFPTTSHSCPTSTSSSWDWAGPLSLSHSLCLSPACLFSPDSQSPLFMNRFPRGKPAHLFHWNQFP